MSADKSKSGGGKAGKKPRPPRPGKAAAAGADKVEPPGLTARMRAVWSRLPSWWPVLVFMAFGLGFRLWTTLWDPLIYPDSTQYLSQAREIRSGAFFSADYDLDEGFIKARRLPPLYSFLIAPFVPVEGGSNAVSLLIALGLAGLCAGLAGWLVKRRFSWKIGAVAGAALFIPLLFGWRLAMRADLQAAAMTVSIALSVAAFIPFYIAAAAVFSRRAALFGCALLSFHPFALFYSSPILSESLFTFLYASVMAASIMALVRPSYPRFILCGALGALLYMTRDVGITAAPLIALAALLKLGFLDRVGFRRSGQMALSALVAFVLVSTPYFIHLRVRTGEWSLTAQMDNTSITEQVQAFGGDRYDRDKLRDRETGTGLIGDQPAQNLFDLLKLSPTLAKKVAVNMGLYGQELFRKWGPLILALAVIGLFGIGREFLLGRDRAKLFLGGWVLVFLVQLWALYALVTQYMVDVRYLYPLMMPGLMLAGQGVNALSSWLAEPRKESGVGWSAAAGLCLLALAAIQFFHLHLCVDPDGLRYFISQRSQDFAVFLIFPLSAAAFLFMAALWPLIGLLPRSWFRRGEKSWLGLVLFPASLAASVALFLIIIPDPQSALRGFLRQAPMLTGPAISQALSQIVPPFFPSTLAAGVALALLWRLVREHLGGGPLLARGVGAFFIGLALFNSLPHLVELHARMSPADLVLKYASGYRQAAAELKARGLVRPDSMICARKPFIAYYLGGRWHLDENNEPMPKTLSELRELLSRPRVPGAGVGGYHQRTIDYLALDSFTMTGLRPALLELTYGVIPMPEMRLIYSRYFPEFNRIITIYDCARPETGRPDRGSAAAHLQKAEEYHHQRNLVFAYQELLMALKHDPGNRSANYNLIEILLLFYRLSHFRSEIELAPNVLYQAAMAAENYARQAPHDPQARELADTLNQRLVDLQERRRRVLPPGAVPEGE